MYNAGNLQRSFFVSRWYTEARFNEMMRHCVEHGILQYFQRKSTFLLESRNVQRNDEESTTPPPPPPLVDTIKLSDFILGFILFGLGMLLSLMVYLLELAWVFLPQNVLWQKMICSNGLHRKAERVYLAAKNRLSEKTEKNPRTRKIFRKQ